MQDRYIKLSRIYCIALVSLAKTINQNQLLTASSSSVVRKKAQKYGPNKPRILLKWGKKKKEGSLLFFHQAAAVIGN